MFKKPAEGKFAFRRFSLGKGSFGLKYHKGIEPSRCQFQGICD